MKPRFGIFFLILLFAMSGFVAWRQYFRIYRQEDTVDISLFPTEINGWQAQDLPLSELELSILETDNVFVRRYTHNDGRSVYLYIVYSQNNRKVSHPPEICYTGSGAVIVNTSATFLDAQNGSGRFEVNRLTVEKGTVEQAVYYWFKVGNAFTSSYWKQQGLIVLKSLLGKSASSALIRISADSRSGNGEAEDVLLTEFGNMIVPLLYEYLP